MKFLQPVDTLSSDKYRQLPRVTMKELISKDRFKQFLEEKSCPAFMIAESDELFNHFRSSLILTLKEFCRKTEEIVASTDSKVEDFMPALFDKVSGQLDSVMGPETNGVLKENILVLVNQTLVELRDTLLLIVEAWIDFLVHRFWLFFEHGVNDFGTFDKFVFEAMVWPTLKTKRFIKLYEEQGISVYFDSLFGGLLNCVAEANSGRRSSLHDRHDLQESARTVGQDSQH